MSATAGMNTSGRMGPRGLQQERVNAQFSAMPATECIGAGRLEGWFATPAYTAEGRGWGHIQSYCFEGDLFFHLQRSPWLRGINFQKKDEVTFEVIEVNGRCEAVKLLLPSQVTEIDDKKLGGGEPTDPNMPSPKDFIGTRVKGNMRSHHLLVAHQSWGFVSSELFSGQVFWHRTENPDMDQVEFDRDDEVEFDVTIDQSRNSQVRAKNMIYIRKCERPAIRPPAMSERKREKKRQWLKNWSATPPPDWQCTFCGWANFGRNKVCNNRNNPGCPGARPPREEWPDIANKRSDEIDPNDANAMKALEQKWRNNEVWGEEAVPVGTCSGGWDPSMGRPPTQPDPNVMQLAPNYPQTNEQNYQQQQQQDVPLQQMQQQQMQQNQYGQLNQVQEQALAGSRQTAPQQQFGMASQDETTQTSLALCLGAFNDMINSDDHSLSLDDKVNALVSEVNSVLGEDRGAKHSFAMQLANHEWIKANGLEVRYKPGQNVVFIGGAANQQQMQQQPQIQAWGGQPQYPQQMQMQGGVWNDPGQDWYGKRKFGQ